MLFELGSLWFWLLSAGFFCACVYAVEEERSWSATFGVITFIAIMYFFGNVNVLAWITANLAQTAGLFVLYFIIGALYSLVKWYFFTKNFARAARLAIERSSHDLLPTRDSLGRILTADEQKAEADRRYRLISFELHGRSFLVNDLLNFKLSSHRSRIILWITHWPFSAVWTLINDPVRIVAREIYEHLSKIFKSIAQRAFSEFLK